MNDSEKDRYIHTSLTAKEFSAIAGVVNVFYLQHPDSSTALDALMAHREMCRQVGHNPEPGMQAAREGLVRPWWRNRRKGSSHE